MPQWLRSKKLWLTVLAGAVVASAPKLGLSQEAAWDAGLLILSGAGIEGLVDTVAVFLGRKR